MTDVALTGLDLLEARCRRSIAEVAGLPPARGFDGQAKRRLLIGRVDRQLDEFILSGGIEWLTGQGR